MTSREDFAGAVERAMREHPLWFDVPRDSAAGEDDVHRVEEELGAALPPDYIWFLQTFGGGDFAFARVYSADAASDLYVSRNQPARTAAFVAIGDDGTGNWWGFDVEDGIASDRVLLRNHETAAVDREGDGGPFLTWLLAEALERS